MEKTLPPIPAKRYFTIGEVGDLCGVKPHVLRYWEQEFTQLRPMKRRGNRRYYQHHEVLMIRRIRELLYEQGFTISGARNRLHEMVQSDRDRPHPDSIAPHGASVQTDAVDPPLQQPAPDNHGPSDAAGRFVQDIRRELLEIRELLLGAP